jgi:hypothetical protein
MTLTGEIIYGTMVHADRLWAICESDWEDAVYMGGVRSDWFKRYCYGHLNNPQSLQEGGC